MRTRSLKEVAKHSEATIKFVNAIIDESFKSWGGRKQNDDFDKKLDELFGGDFFLFASSLNTDGIDKAVSDFKCIITNKLLRDYAITRLVNIRCAHTDESMFIQCDGVEGRENEKDHMCDVVINGIEWDIKSTFIPTNEQKFGVFVNGWEEIKNNPIEFCRKMYAHQSNGVRSHPGQPNNRFFIISKSYVNEKNTWLLKCGYKARFQLIKDVCRDLSDENVLTINELKNIKDDKLYDDVKCVICLFKQNEDGSFSYELVKNS